MRLRHRTTNIASNINQTTQTRRNKRPSRRQHLRSKLRRHHPTSTNHHAINSRHTIHHHATNVRRPLQCPLVIRVISLLTRILINRRRQTTPSNLRQVINITRQGPTKQNRPNPLLNGNHTKRKRQHTNHNIQVKSTLVID